MTSTDPLPYDPEIENALLGFLMERPDSLPGMMAKVPADAFHHPANQGIYREMAAMMAADKSINMVTLTSWLRDRGTLDAYGGMVKMTDMLSTSILSPSVVREMVETVLAKKKLRDGIVAVQSALAEAGDPRFRQDPGLWIASVVERLSGIQADISGRNHRTMEELVADATERYEAAARNGGQLAGISTGFPLIDLFTGGFREGQMWVISGGTSDGKSAYTGQLLINAAMNGTPCCLYSLEMSAEENMDRYFANVSGVPSGTFLSGKFNREDAKKFMEAAKVLKALPLQTRDVSGIKLSPLLADMRYMATRHGIKVFAVDYGQLVDPDQPEHTREREVAKMSKAFKEASKALKCTTLVMSQLNDDGRLRESRAIGHDAHVVASMQVPMDDNNERLEDQRIVKLDKNRNGPRWKKIRYGFYGETFSFREFEEVVKPAQQQQKNGFKPRR